MKTSPFKVMTSAALASALAVPAVATTAPSQVEAAETEILDIAIEVDGEVKTVSYDEFVNALFDGSGEVYDLYTEGEIVAVSVEEGQYVKYEALANAVFDAEEGTTTTELLAELNTEEDALVAEETVAEYDNFVGDSSEQAIADFDAVGAKKLEVEFNQPVDDEEVSFSVKKGSISSTVKEVNYSDDMTTATLVLSGKMTEGDYTVTVTGAVEGELTESVSVADETVENIEFTSENAIATSTDASTGEIEDLVVNYKVFNQYGEDISRTTSLEESAGIVADSVTAANGRLTISGVRNSPRIGETFAVSLVHPESATSATASVEVSTEAVASEFEIKGLYSEEDEALTEDSDPSEYYVLVDVKDQYGNKMEDPSQIEEGTIVNVTNRLVASVNGLDGTQADFETIRIDGEEQIALQLADGTQGNLQSGETTVTLISSKTGESESKTIEVAPGVKADTINFSAPSSIVSEGETVKVPFEAFDMNGNLIEKAHVLNDLAEDDGDGKTGVSLSVTGGGYSGSEPVKFKQNYVSGEAYLEVTPTSEGKVTVTAITATNNVESVSFDVKEVAKPTIITGIDPDVATNALIYESFTVGAGDFVVQDQYGRNFGDLTNTSFTGWLDGNTNVLGDSGKYRVVLEEEDSNPTFNATGDKFTGNDGEGSVKFEAGSESGSETISFQLEKYDGSEWKDVVGSNYDLDARAVELDELESYSADDVGKMFDEHGYEGSELSNDDKYDKTFTLHGFTSDESKVVMPSNPSERAVNGYGVTTGETLEYYTVTTNNESILDPQDSGNDTELDVVSSANYGVNQSEKEYQTKITVNHDGETVTKDVVVSKDKPSVQSVAFFNPFPYPAEVVPKSDSTLNDNTASQLLPHAWVVDQYGAYTQVSSDATVTFTQDVQTEVTSVTYSNLFEEDGNGDIEINNNGKPYADIDGLDPLDTFTATYTFANGTTASLKVVVTD